MGGRGQFLLSDYTRTDCKAGFGPWAVLRLLTAAMVDDEPSLKSSNQEGHRILSAFQKGLSSATFSKSCSEKPCQNSLWAKRSPKADLRKCSMLYRSLRDSQCYWGIKGSEKGSREQLVQIFCCLSVHYIYIWKLQ